VLEGNFERLHLFRKKTIVKNKYGYYDECNVMIRLRLEIEGTLRLEGYFQVKSNPQYLWNCFLFVNQRG
jgi:hypothetical protein